MSANGRKRTIRNVQDLQCAVKRRLEQQRFMLHPSWPYEIGVELPHRDELMNHYGAELERDEALREYVNSKGCTITEVTRQAGVTKNVFVRSVSVPSEACALRMMSRADAAQYHRSRDRLHLLRQEFAVADEAVERVAKLTDDFADIDFELMLEAAHYCDEHDVHNMTARQVPIPGFHSKWLGSENSARRRAIAMLIETDALRFKERPGEIRLRMLGDQYQGLPDCVAVQPWVERVPKGLHTAIIVENKDTYQHMPVLEGGVCIWGCGWAALRIPTLLPWVKDLSRVFYWGDMDASGLEILNDLRGKGLPCESVLMDMDAYRRYERFGTNVAPSRKQGSIEDGREVPIRTRPAKTMDYLNDSENELYRRLCTGQDVEYLRLEQERIPLDDAWHEIELRLGEVG
ncbi:DUF3322 and DUF2220 domain-containing protein [Bifidobacterium oedipodis]|uniref:Wadjet protein JetD C-terminal domain-containing protein n=1 Tax=Bifidobacterium oedipodis TaxID=2675322 RepID=A0A7Y0HRP4_9BIFI|nr:DUF3322 and DUF2220 domain-containing protein [Bifidobacterium sp. DSM 109957]NMM94320.1 hypothetical protein [Bifidobacterium sp. DSM 109957]